MNDLPIELMVHVYSYLDLVDIARLARTCRSMYQATKLWTPPGDLDLSALTLQQRNLITNVSIHGVLSTAILNADSVDISRTHVSTAGVLLLAQAGLSTITIRDCPFIKTHDLTWRLTALTTWCNTVDIDVRTTIDNDGELRYYRAALRDYVDTVRLHKIMSGDQSVDIQDADWDTLICQRCGQYEPEPVRCSMCAIRICDDCIVIHYQERARPRQRIFCKGCDDSISCKDCSMITHCNCTVGALDYIQCYSCGRTDCGRCGNVNGTCLACDRWYCIECDMIGPGQVCRWACTWASLIPSYQETKYRLRA